MSQNGIDRPSGDVDHDEWKDAGNARVGPNSPATLDLWECQRCDYVLEGVRL